jgi:hypothetical protein
VRVHKLRGATDGYLECLNDLDGDGFLAMVGVVVGLDGDRES